MESGSTESSRNIPNPQKNWFTVTSISLRELVLLRFHDENVWEKWCKYQKPKVYYSQSSSAYLWPGSENMYDAPYMSNRASPPKKSSLLMCFQSPPHNQQGVLFHQRLPSVLFSRIIPPTCSNYFPNGIFSRLNLKDIFVLMVLND